MSRKSSLSTQTGKLFIVIRKPKEIMDKINDEKILSYCTTFGHDYVFICHDHDVDASTGLIITKHYHIVLNALAKDKRLSTHLRDIVSFFGFENADGICIEKYDSYEGSLQYLLHKNNKEKTQHDISELRYNIDKGDLETYLSVDLETNEITFERVYTICMTSSNKIEIIRQLGLANYQKYRATILDIFTDIKQ